MELVHKQFYITRTQDRAVKHFAHQQKMTEAEIFRKALDQFLAGKSLLEMQDSFVDLIGIFEGPSSVNHDDIYS